MNEKIRCPIITVCKNAHDVDQEGHTCTSINYKTCWVYKQIKFPIVTRINSNIQPHLTNEQINACLKGERKIEWWVGSSIVSVLAGPLSPKEMERYLQIKNQHFVVYNNRKQVDRELHASAAGIYFFWCCANSEPYITVSSRRKYCNVGIDLITLDNLRTVTLSDEGRKKIGHLLEEASVKTKNIICAFGPIVTFSFSHSIPKDKGPEIATKLYRIWSENKIDLTYLSGNKTKTGDA